MATFALAKLCLVEPSPFVDWSLCANDTTIFTQTVYNTTAGVVTDGLSQEVQYTYLNTSSSIIECKDSRTMLASPTCQEHCATQGDTALKCYGPSSYCTRSGFSCSPTLSSSNCYCQPVSISSYEQIEVNGVWYNVTNSSTLIVSQADEPVWPPSGRLYNSGRQLFALDQTGLIIYVTFDGSTVTINSIAQNLTSYVVFIKNTWNTLVPYSGGQLQFTIPGTVLATSGVLKVDVYVNGLNYQSSTFTINGKKLCQVDDCILCESTWRNWSCLHSTQQFVVVIIMIMLICLFAAACPALVMLFIWSLRCLLFPIKMCMSITRGCWRSKFRKDMQKKAKKLKSMKAYFMEEDKESEAENGSSMTRVNPAMAIIMIVMVLSVGANSQCTSGIFIPSTFLSCLNNGTTQTCQLTTQLTISIQTAGTSSCFYIYNPNNSSDILLKGEVTYESLIEHFQMSYLYDTMPWKGYQGSRKRCSQSGPCPDNCKSVYPDDVTAAGQLSDTTLLSYQGRSICTKGCGCAGCGCFYCSSSCIYSRYSIGYDGSGDYARVYNIASGIKKPKVSIAFRDSQDNLVASGIVDFQTEISTPTGSIPYVEGPFSLSVIGSLASDVTPYLANKLIVDMKNYNVYWGPASDANAPVQGSIGEIQGTNFQSMVNGESASGAEHNYMQYDQSIVSLQTGSTSNRYTFTASAYSKIFNQIQLPNYVSGNYWSSGVNLDNNVAWVDSTVTAPAALLVTIETISNITFSRVVNLVCPSLSFVNASGCYQCDIGVTLSFTGRSTCSPGFVAVTSATPGIGVYTPALTLSTTESQYVVAITTNVASNNVCITFTGNGGSQVVCAIFTASFYSPQSPTGPDNNGTQTDNGGDSGGFWKSIGNFFKDIFNGVAKWWQYIIFVIFFVVCLVIFFLALPFIVQLLKATYGAVKWGVNKIRRVKPMKEKDDKPTSNLNEIKTSTDSAVVEPKTEMQVNTDGTRVYNYDTIRRRF